MKFFNIYLGKLNEKLMMGGWILSLLVVGGDVLKRMEYKVGFNYLEIKDEINEKLDFFMLTKQ